MLPELRALARGLCLAAGLASAGVGDSALADPARAASVVPNGSFEQRAEDGPAAWRIQRVGQPGGRIDVDLDPAEKQHGEYSLRLAGVGPASVQAVSQRFPVEPDHPYVLSLRYRGEGFSPNGRFAGANAWVQIDWYDAADRAVGHVDVGAPYDARPWSLMLRLLTAPSQAVAGRLHANLRVERGAPRTTVWLDDVRLRPCSTRSAPSASIRSWSVAVEEAQNPAFRAIAADDTESGHAVLANPRFHRAPSYLVDGLYSDDLAPGAYRAVFRLKIGTAEPGAAVATLDVMDTALVNSVLATIEVSPDASGDAVRYRETELPFLRPPGGRLFFRVRWLGGPATWVDTVSIREERLIDADGFADVLAP